MTEPRYLDPPPTPRALSGPPARGRVLVLSPHPDDELIGPGGTLLQHRDLGDPISIVILTDGGNTGMGPDAPVGLPARREQESRAAARRLGAKVEFLGHPDGRRAREEDLGVLVPQIAERLQRLQPDVVYAPHEGEIHGDHHVTAVATRWALAQSGVAARCFAYEVWSPCVAELVVDITAQMDEKLAIARLYTSQREQMLHYFQGLNAYRAAYLPGAARYGEAFRNLVGDPS